MSTPIVPRGDPTTEYDAIALPVMPTLSTSTDEEQPSEEINTQRSSVRGLWSQAKHNASLIRTAPRELWVIFMLKFFASYSYFSLGLVLTVFLSQEFNMSDMNAGWTYGLFGVTSSFYGIICGWVIDFLGIRLSLLVGATISFFSRALIALTSSRVIALIFLIGVLPFGEALGIPIMTIAIKRYTNHTNRTFAFSLFYSVMNIAAFIVGPIVDGCRSLFRNGVSLPVKVPFIANVEHLSALRLVLVTGSASAAVLLIMTIFYIKDVELSSDGKVLSFAPNRTNPFQSMLEACRDRAFWRLLVLTVLLVGVRLVFSHTSATMPKYLLRQFGEDTPFGLIYAINPFFIMFLVPLVAVFTKNVPSFPMILYGSFFAAASPFFICIQQSYTMVVMFMVGLSLGEAVYSPRVYEYSLELARRGSEGLYSSLASAPLFSVSLLSGGQSGWLISTFMPVDGPHNGKMLWAIIGMTCMTSPILMFIFRDFIGKDSKNGTEESTS